MGQGDSSQSHQPRLAVDLQCRDETENRPRCPWRYVKTIPCGDRKIPGTSVRAEKREESLVDGGKKDTVREKKDTQTVGTS